jgi:hypothetical protein
VVEASACLSFEAGFGVMWPDMPLNRLSVCLFLTLFAGLPVTMAAPIELFADGSVAIPLHLGDSRQSALLRFGLPRILPTRQWREGKALRQLWVTNGIRYTETALITSFLPARENVRPIAGSIASDALPPPQAIRVFLLNVHGENTNQDYTEASAGLSILIAGQSRELELNDGLVLLLMVGKGRSIAGALEISDSAIKNSSGQLLRFQGNIPPSLQGSFTLKIPLEVPLDPASADFLRDIDFDTELRKTLKLGGSKSPGAVELLFRTDFASPTPP